MSRVNGVIEKALKPIAPVAFHHYSGSDATYITYFTYNERQGIISDDDELTTIYGVQVDVNTKGNIEKLVRDTKKAMKNVGFARTSEIEMYNKDTKTYRKSIFFRTQLESEKD